MTKTSKTILGAAMAGLLSAAAAPSAHAKKVKKDATDPLVPCFGVNRCGGMGQCSSKSKKKSHACAGQNLCKGQGWLLMPKESCLALEGGSLSPVAAVSADAEK